VVRERGSLLALYNLTSAIYHDIKRVHEFCCSLMMPENLQKTQLSPYYEPWALRSPPEKTSVPPRPSVRGSSKLGFVPYEVTRMLFGWTWFTRPTHTNPRFQPPTNERAQRQSQFIRRPSPGGLTTILIITPPLEQLPDPPSSMTPPLERR